MPNPWEMNWGGQQGGFVPLTGAPPDYPYKGPQAAANLAKAQGDVAQQPYDIRLKAAQAAEAEAKARKESGLPAPMTPQQRADKLFQNDETLDTINKALELARGGKGGMSATGFGAMFSGVPTSNAKLLSNYIKTLKSNLTIDNMLQLKNASATGATGFGQLSNKEGETLASTVTALDQSMSGPQLVDALNKVNNHYHRFRASIEGIDPDKIKFDTGQPPAIGTKRRQVIGPGSSSAPPGGGGQGGGPLARPDDPLSPTNLGLGNGNTNAQIDPAVIGIRRRVASMVSGGASGGQIRNFLQNVGVDPTKVNGIDAAVAFRKRHPGYLGSYPVDIGVRDIPLSGTRQMLARAANSPFGAGAVGAANAASMGGLDEIVGATGGNGALANAGKQALAAQYPGSSLIGNIIGGAGAAAGLEAGLARAGLAGGGLLAPRAIAADALYGGGYGAGENNDDRLGGAILGAGTAIPGGLGGRALAGVTGRALTGVTNADVGRLARANVPMTLGTIARGGLKSVEDKLTSFPVIGDLINARRTEGLRGFNAAAFKEAAAPLTDQVTGNIGEAGVEDLADTVTGGYKKALGGVQLAIDPKFGFDLGNSSARIQKIPRVGGELYQTLSDTVPTYFDNGGLTGDNLQSLLDHVRQIKAGYKNDPLYGSQIKPALDQFHDYVVNMVERQAPDVMPAFRAADKAYKNRKIVGNAVKAAINTDGLFTPAQLGQQSRAAANKFGNNADTTQRPFFDLQRAGQNILPSKIPDSGTAGRIALPLALSGVGGAVGGVRGYAGSDGGNTAGDTASGVGSGVLTGATLAALLAAPGTRTGQQVIQNVLTAPRPAPVVNIGQIVRDRARLAGLVGGPLALQYQNFGD